MRENRTPGSVREAPGNGRSYREAKKYMKTPEDICPDFPEWPGRWHGVKQDVPYGEAILDIMRLFVSSMINQGLKDRSIRNHIDNLFLLGGEIIRRVSLNEEYNIPPGEYLRRNVDETGGLLCRHIYSEYAQDSFDATCRKLHKFLNIQP